MGSRQVKSGLKVGFLIRSDRQALQGIQPLLDPSRGKTPASLCNQQRVAGLQMPQVRHKRPILFEVFQYPFRARLLLIVEEPRYDN